MYLFGIVCYFLPVAVAPAPGVFHFNPPPLFIHTILIRLCCRYLPCPHQINSCLIPPPHPHLCPPLPFRRLAQLHNRPHRNILHDRIMPSPNVDFFRLKPRLLSRQLRRGVLSPSVQPPPWQPSLQLPRHLVLEKHQDPYHMGGNHPRLCTKEQHQLDGGFRENPETRGV